MTHALIIGGGIGGAVTAMALHKAGIGATVYEAYPAEAEDVGAFLVLFPNGLEALRTIDAHGPVLDASFSASRIELLSSSGERMGVRPASTGAQVDGREPLGTRTLKRAALWRALRDEAVRRGVAVEYGKRFVSAETAPDGTVTARFADGGTARGDVLIGADGLHSVTRRLIDPEAPEPQYTGQTTVCGYARDVPSELAPEQSTYRMIRGSRAFLGCTLAPDGTVWWFANTPGEELPRERLSTATPDRAERWREHVAGLFADDASPAAAIVRSTGGEIVATNAYDIARTPHWSRGPLVVLGDAAHTAAPNAAQGASMAIEDGVVLARCLRDLPDTGEAFAAYERLRRERVETVVEESARMNRSIIRRGQGNAAAGAGDPTGQETAEPPRRPPEGVDWLTHYRIDWDEKVRAGGA
ncbi:FAD-dependent monooxygenase [Streptomyces sp. NPDC048172]|uniref:FAD-dependent monooxygenase n=1 Tax=Streptomyces sp. NPDC048172 TaxID=3365505 RepID=UPI00371BE7C6